MATESTRVLIVLTSNSRRGAEIEGATLGEELAARGMDTTVVALAPGSSPGTLDVPTLGSTALGSRTLIALRRLGLEHQIVIAYGSSALPACAIALGGTRIPWVYRSVGDPAAWSGSSLKQLRTRLLLRRVALVVALWPQAGEWFTDRYGVPHGRVVTIPNARSSDKFRPPTSEERHHARLSYGAKANEPVIGVVGSLSSEKRAHLAITSIAKVAGALAVVVGDGPERPIIEAYSHEVLPGRVVFTGVLEDVRPVYWALDVLLVASRTEGMPGAIIEAAMCGVPVAATAVGAIPIMFELGVVGQLLETVDVNQISAALSDILVAPALPGDLSNFGWSEVAERWHEVVEHVVHRNSPLLDGCPGSTT